MRAVMSRAGWQGVSSTRRPLQPPGRFPGRHPRHPSVAATELYNRTRSTSVAVDRGEQPRCSMGSNIQRLVDQRIQLSPSTDRSPESRRVQRIRGVSQSDFVFRIAKKLEGARSSVHGTGSPSSMWRMPMSAVLIALLKSMRMQMGHG